jgi:hypothetical protein
MSKLIYAGAITLVISGSIGLRRRPERVRRRPPQSNADAGKNG